MAVGLVDHAPDVAAAIITLGVVAFFVFPLRVYVRVNNGAWGMDDWCMTAATVSLEMLSP